MSQTIKAVRCHRYAAFDDEGKLLPKPLPLREVLSLDEIERPGCADEHVLIEVLYASVQYPDALQAQGLYQLKPDLPYIPGMDVAGTVLEVGAGVEHVEPGDRVVAQINLGGLAEITSAPSQVVFKAPARSRPIKMCQSWAQLYSRLFSTESHWRNKARRSRSCRWSLWGRGNGSGGISQSHGRASHCWSQRSREDGIPQSGRSRPGFLLRKRS